MSVKEGARGKNKSVTLDYLCDQLSAQQLTVVTREDDCGSTGLHGHGLAVGLPERSAVDSDVLIGRKMESDTQAGQKRES